VVPESQDAIAGAIQEVCAPLVGWISTVLSAIRLDDQMGFVADEVANEGTDRLLLAELGVGQLTRPEQAPEFPFRIGHIAPQSLGAF
jgi:hypothetical protein